MALGRGKTEHSGPRDMSRKSGHWGLTEEAKAWASRARRRDEKRELADETGSSDFGAPCPACGASAQQSTNPDDLARSVCYCGHPRYYDHKHERGDCPCQQ